jgi:hypothetical protein
VPTLPEIDRYSLDFGVLEFFFFFFFLAVTELIRMKIYIPIDLSRSICEA